MKNQWSMLRNSDKKGTKISGFTSSHQLYKMFARFCQCFAGSIPIKISNKKNKAHQNGWGMILKPRMILQPKPDDSETKTDDSATKSDSETKTDDSETKDDSATKDTWKPKWHGLAMNLDTCLTCQKKNASGDDAMLSVAASVSEEGT